MYFECLLHIMCVCGNQTLQQTAYKMFCIDGRLQLLSTLLFVSIIYQIKFLIEEESQQRKLPGVLHI